MLWHTWQDPRLSGIDGEVRTERGAYVEPHNSHPGSDSGMQMATGGKEAMRCRLNNRRLPGKIVGQRSGREHNRYDDQQYPTENRDTFSMCICRRKFASIRLFPNCAGERLLCLVIHKYWFGARGFRRAAQSRMPQCVTGTCVSSILCTQRIIYSLLHLFGCSFFTDVLQQSGIFIICSRIGQRSHGSRHEDFKGKQTERKRTNILLRCGCFVLKVRTRGNSKLAIIQRGMRISRVVMSYVGDGESGQWHGNRMRRLKTKWGHLEMP